MKRFTDCGFRIMEEYHVTMVFGIYAVDEILRLSLISADTSGNSVRVNEHVKSFHALYLSKGTNTLYCDFYCGLCAQRLGGLRKIIYRLYEEAVFGI